VLAGARDRGLAFITYDDFARGDVASPGLALSFDDTSVQAWVDLIPLFARYGARVTFFVSRYVALDDADHALLHQLADAGHAIEAHTVLHLHAPDYVAHHGLATYLEDEVVPSIDALRTDGFDVAAFAYPFGERTEEIDRAILDYVPVLRSVSYTWSPIESPCPH
jgi:peptidoglycan/xylan/chitin deacetylase (PgdA/CDA1 family)